MNWFLFCSENFKMNVASAESLKIYVQKNKISADEYKQITGIEFVV